jgi:hypothetical protein
VFMPGQAKRGMARRRLAGSLRKRCILELSYKACMELVGQCMMSPTFYIPHAALIGYPECYHLVCVVRFMCGKGVKRRDHSTFIQMLQLRCSFPLTRHYATSSIQASSRLNHAARLPQSPAIL